MECNTQFYKFDILPIFALFGKLEDRGDEKGSLKIFYGCLRKYNSFIIAPDPFIGTENAGVGEAGRGNHFLL